MKQYVKCCSWCADTVEELLRAGLRRHTSTSSGWTHPLQLIRYFGTYVKPARDVIGQRIWIAEKVNRWVEDSRTTIRNGVRVRRVIRAPAANGLWYAWRFEWPDEGTGALLEEMFVVKWNRKHGQETYENTNG